MTLDTGMLNDAISVVFILRLSDKNTCHLLKAIYILYFSVCRSLPSPLCPATVGPTNSTRLCGNLADGGAENCV